MSWIDIVWYLNTVLLFYMKWYVVGYSWCSHFQHAVKKLSESVDTSVYCFGVDEPDREKMIRKVDDIISDRQVIGSPGVTSPQILCCSAKYAICIPGDSELTAISNLKQFATSKLASYKTFVPHNPCN